MAATRKPLSHQVVVVIGASSGIGLATARMAAARGAAVVLAARSADALRQAADAIEAEGGRALAVVADVSVEADVRRIAAQAIGRFGGFDTWVNNASAGVYCTLAELPLSEHRRVFETNYWGVVHGSIVAVEHFRARPGGGTLVNVGSINSDVAVPLLSAYSASKHAVKGFTNALRAELIAAGDPITVTLVKPSGVATPFPQRARNHMDREPRIVPPLYAPEIVADAILFAASHARREIEIGPVGLLGRIAYAIAPRLSDRMVAAAIPPLSKASEAPGGPDALDAPMEAGAVHHRRSRGLPFSLYAEYGKRPGAFAAGALVLGGLLARSLLRRR